MIDWLTIGAWLGVILICGSAYAVIRLVYVALGEPDEPYGDVVSLPAEIRTGRHISAGSRGDGHSKASPSDTHTTRHDLALHVGKATKL